MLSGDGLTKSDRFQISKGEKIPYFFLNRGAYKLHKECTRIPFKLFRLYENTHAEQEREGGLKNVELISSVNMFSSETLPTKNVKIKFSVQLKIHNYVLFRKVRP